MKFSVCISNLTEVWLLWMKNHKMATDEGLNTDTRHSAILECERLIGEEYRITEMLDGFFDNEKERN